MITNIILWAAYSLIFISYVYTITNLWNAFTPFKTSNILSEDAYTNAHIGALVSFFLNFTFGKIAITINPEFDFSILICGIIFMVVIGIICTIIGILNKTIPYKFRWLNSDEASVSLMIGLMITFIYCLYIF